MPLLFFSYAQTRMAPVLKATFSDALTESSGLVLAGGKLWTHNDGGEANTLFSVDTVTGRILQTVYVDGYPNTDWEDITADERYLYVGDFGNNGGTRTDLKILRIDRSQIGNDTIVHVHAEAISFAYDDQLTFEKSKTHNFDCESVCAIGDSLYLFTKNRGDLQTRVYGLPKKPGSYRIKPYTSFAANGLITGADYDPVRKELVLIGYLKGHENPFIWYLSGFSSTLFFSGNKQRIELGDGTEWQTEGICFRSPGNLYISSEKSGPRAASLFTLHLGK
jgi:hypothetical protein